MNVREFAFQILLDVYKKGTFSNLALNRALNNEQLNAPDKAFLTRLVYGVIQNSIYLDYALNQLLPEEKMRNNLKVLIKSAFYQMHFMDKVPHYAIINETVEIIKKIDGNQVGKFGNAILRKLSEAKFRLEKTDFSDDLSYYSVLYSCPLWIMKMIAKQYGEEHARNYARQNQIPPRICLRVNRLRSSVDQITQNKDFVRGKLAIDAVYYTGNSSLQDLAEFQMGLITAQDESGQLVAPLLDPKAGERILDMCAAPGSKTGHIAELMRNQGQIVAVDLYPHRIKLLHQSLTRLGIKNTVTHAMDALALLEDYPPACFDRILLDAPCSGLGVVRRKPDILLHASPESIDELVILQKRLINQAAVLLKTGGTLVYSTCTLNKKENEMQIKYLRDTYPSFKLIEEKMIFPEDYDTDGFYMAKLVKE